MMFLKENKVTRDGKTYTYHKIVESYRDEHGKPRHRVVQNLGSLDDKAAEKIRMVLAVNNNASLASVSDIVVKEHWMFLPIAVLHHIWQMFNLNTSFKNSLIIETMVINRCVDPCSKIRVVDWTSKTVLPALANCDSFLQKYKTYRELDFVTANEPALQAHLYKQLEKIDSSLGEGFFYDITSTYMEGSQCIISKFGYSRDHRPDLQQIVIALMVTPLGSPFYWKVLDGNTQDVTTLPSVVDDLKDRFGLENCHLVFDRGMVSDDRLKYLEGHKTTYLTAMDKDEIAINPNFDMVLPHPVEPENYEQTLTSFGFSKVDEEGNFYTQEYIAGKRKLIFSFDVVRFEADQKTWDGRIMQVEEWVAQKNAELLLAKKSRKKEKLEDDIKQLLTKRKLKNILHANIAPLEIPLENKNGTTRIVKTFQIELTTNVANEAKAKRLHGITCFITNIPDFEPRAAIQKYREKNKIEEAFREMKSELLLRPIYLTRVNRVKAHVTICVLAYLLKNTIEIMLKKQGFCDTATNVIRELMSCQFNEVGFQKSDETTITMTQLTEQQKRIIETLGCDNIIEANSIKQLTDFMKRCL